ncbi:HU family DNA-binding protein [Parabacteroides sp. OttesenSCG-928-G21]|nr:HU family DNA-binding protein [Parabacteroides sp. OttesenSCG-928-G21]
MNNRLSIQELASILSGKTGKSKADMELFLRTFVSEVTEGLCRDNLVKIKGIGTFKLILAEQRESVHVNTGERFIIPAHHKLSYLPDKDLKELVNEPFALFETTEINEDAQLAEQIDAKKDRIEDKEIPLDNPKASDEAIITEEPVVVSSPVSEDKKTVIQPENTLPGDKTIKTSSSKTISTIKWTVLGTLFVLLLVFAGVFGYMYFSALFVPDSSPPSFTRKSTNNIPHEVANEVEPKKDSIPSTNDTPVLPVNDSISSTETEVIAPKTENVSVAESTEKRNTSTVQPVTTINTSKSEQNILARTSITAGIRLTLISQEYYKHKIFWVYIYEFNKDVIKNPNLIDIGTEILIPKPEVYGIDANDPASIEKATALQNQIVAAL